MKKEHEQTVQRVFRRGKVKVLIYPVTIASFLYGLQLGIFTDILNRYRVYALISDHVSHAAVGTAFIVIPLAMLISYFLNQRILLFITSNVLLIIWTMFAVSFFISPPPNTIWIFAGLMVYLSFSLTRRV